jgi:hypothetical protein
MKENENDTFYLYISHSMVHETVVTVWESLSVYLWKVGGLFPNTLYNVSGFSLPHILTDSHQISEKLMSMAKNYKQTV